METFTICFRARLKKGWVEWVPSCFSARFTHPETWFLPPFFSSLKQRIPSGKGCFFFSLQTLCESSERPNPPVVQKRDPRTFPRFAVKKEREFSWVERHAFFTAGFQLCFARIFEFAFTSGRRKTILSKCVSTRFVYMYTCIHDVYMYVIHCLCVCVHKGLVASCTQSVSERFK